MKRHIINLLIKLLKYLSNDRIGIFYRSNKEITREEANMEVFKVIQKIFIDYYGMPFNLLVSKSRKREICEKRQLLQFFIYNYTSLSKTEIGRLTNRTHCSIIYSIKMVLTLIEIDKNITKQFDDLCEKIENALYN